MNNTINNSALNTYLKKLKKACPRNFRTQLISELSNSLYDFLDFNPNATYEDFEQRFGVPENCSSEYIMALDDEDITKLVNKSGWAKKCILVATVILVITTIVAGILMVRENSRTAAYSHTIIIEYDTTTTLD